MLIYGYMKVKFMTRSSTASKSGRIAFGVGMVVILALFAVLPVRADVRILSSPGGAVDAYLAAFARVRQSGERVVIDGPCLSACTLVLSTIPRNRICVTRRAVLGFHAPAMVRLPHRLYDARARGHPYRHCFLSRGSTLLDQEARRANAEGPLPSG